jgi:hypothetical protein
MYDPDESSSKKRIRKWHIALGIIGILIILFILNPFSRPSDPYEEPLESIPFATKRYVREGEPINFTSHKCKGDIVSYFWDFDDGQISTQINPKYIFMKTGYYNVSLEIEDVTGKTDSGYFIIGVQPQNNYKRVTTSQEHVLDPRFPFTMGGEVQIGPNIDQARIYVVFSAIRLVGDCTINITLRSIFSDDNIVEENIINHTYVRNGDSLFFDRLYKNNILPSYIQHTNSFLVFNATLEQGRWEHSLMELAAIFEIEHLGLPPEK